MRLKKKDDYKTSISNSLIIYLAIDLCSPNLCQNGGQCISDVDSFTCQCKSGWTGETCNEGNYDFFTEY